MRCGSFSSVLFTLSVLLLASSVWELNDIDRQVAYSAEPDASAKSLTPTLGVPSSTDVTGVVEDTSLPTSQPQVLWSITSDLPNRNGEVVSQDLSDPATADGILYFGDDAGRVIALRAQDQKFLWVHNHGTRIFATPSVDEEYVYIGTTHGITAIQREDGKQVWNRKFEGGAGECTPVVIDDRVYVAGSDGFAYCLNRKDGETFWKSEFYSDAPTAADLDEEFNPERGRFEGRKARPNGSASNGTLFLQSVFDQARVIAFDCETGERRWTFQTKGWIGPAPTIYNDRVYVVSQDKFLYCLELETGKLVWKHQAPNWLASRVAVYRDKVYLPNHGAKVFELDSENGALLRTFQSPDPEERKGNVYSFPLIAENVMYFNSGPGLLFAFDLRSGNMLWKIRPMEDSELYTNPTTDGSRIYVKSRQSKHKGKAAIAAIGVKEE